MQGPNQIDPRMLQQLAYLYALANQAHQATQANFEQVGVRVNEVYSSINRDMHDKAERLKDYYKSHVASSKETILRGCQGLSGQALVVGIGNGTDIPLEDLCRQFDKVTIQDIDEEALARAEKKVPEALRGKIEIVKGDLTGLVEEFVSLLKSHGARPLPDFFRELCQFFASAAPKRLEKLPKQKFDYVISAQVATQLASCLFCACKDFMQTFYGQSPDCCSDKDLAKAVTAFSVRNIHQHLQDLAFWVKPQGKVYFSDTKEEQYLVRPLPNATPVKFGEQLPMLTQDSLRAGLDSFQNSLDLNEWVWYAFVPNNHAGAKGSAFTIISLVMKPISPAKESDPILLK